MTAEVNHRRDGCNPRFRQELFKDKTETQGSENSKPLRLSRGLDRDSVGVVEKVRKGTALPCNLLICFSNYISKSCNYFLAILYSAMPDRFNKNVVPLVQHCHALGEQNDLPPADMQSFVTEDKNMLGSSGVNPFPPSALIAPMSEDEIVAIVKKAYATRSQVRVIGSAHSSPSNIIVDAPHGVLPPNVVLITLTKYRGVTIDKVKKFATVKAGTNLDIDPEDSDSTQGNSLAFQLQNAGFALPVTGGITHQTIAGFLATGTCISHLSLIGFPHFEPQDLPEALFYTAFTMLCTALPSLMVREPSMFFLEMIRIPPSSLRPECQLDYAELSQRSRSP